MYNYKAGVCIYIYTWSSDTTGLYCIIVRHDKCIRDVQNRNNCHMNNYENESDSFMDQVSLVVHTLNAYPYVQLENVCEQLLGIGGQEMHGSDAGQRAHHSSDGDVVVDPLDDHLREPSLVPGPEDERTDELVFDCRRHLVFSARLSQCAWEENGRG